MGSRHLFEIVFRLQLKIGKRLVSVEMSEKSYCKKWKCESRLVCSSCVAVLLYPQVLKHIHSTARNRWEMCFLKLVFQQSSRWHSFCLSLIESDGSPGRLQFQMGSIGNRIKLPYPSLILLAQLYVGSCYQFAKILFRHIPRGGVSITI